MYLTSIYLVYTTRYMGEAYFGLPQRERNMDFGETLIALTEAGHFRAACEALLQAMQDRQTSLTQQESVGTWLARYGKHLAYDPPLTAEGQLVKDFMLAHLAK